MKLVTLNTWGKHGPFKERWDFFLQELAELKPDVLCLQEVMDDELTQMLQKVLGFSYFVSSYEAGLLIVSRFPISDHHVLTYRRYSMSERNDERKAVIAKIKISKKKLVIANTHLAWKAEDRPVRKDQIGELLKALKKTGLPSLICGDLNDIPGSSPLELVKAAGYENLIHAYHSDIITWDNRNPFIQSHSVKFPDRQIDYILTHKSVANLMNPRTCRLAFNHANENLVYPSDHYGIYSEFTD